MSLVVIVEPEEANAERIRAILDSVDRQFEYEMYRSPEQVIDIVESRKPDVLISDMELPVMTAEELFSLVEMLCPDTVRVIMTDVNKIAKTISVMNASRTFKVITKPCRVADDLLVPICAALTYRKLRRDIKEAEDAVNFGVFSTEQDYHKMEQTCAENERNFRRIQEIFADMLRKNLALGNVDGELLKRLERWYTWMTESYIGEVIEASGDYAEIAGHLTAIYHKPEQDCSFLVRNLVKEPIVKGQMNEMAFLLQLLAKLCEELLHRYHIKAVIENTEKSYILRFGCTLPRDEEGRFPFREKNMEIGKALMKSAGKCVEAFGYKAVMLRKGDEIIVNVAVYKQQIFS